MASALSQIETMKAMHLQKHDEMNKNNMQIDSNRDQNENKNAMDVDKTSSSSNECKNNELSKEFISKIESTALELAKMRKKQSKKPFTELVSMTVIDKEYKIQNDLCYNAHSEVDVGINCLHLSVDNKYIVSGGNDAQIICYNRHNKSFEHVLKGHSKRINDVKYVNKSNNLLVSASSDCSSIVWQLSSDDQSESYKKLWSVNNVHKESVFSVCVHPLNDYFLSASREGLWCLHNLYSQQTLLTVKNDELEIGFNAMELHPDGQIIATGTSNKKLKIWDIRTKTIGYTFDVGAEDSISSINFNQNGYYLASSHFDGIVNVWDLRKIGKSENKQFLKQIRLREKVRRIQFDLSGQYLAIGQPNGISLYLSKKWTKFASFKCSYKDVTAIQFGQNAKFIVTASKERKVKIMTIDK